MFIFSQDFSLFYKYQLYNCKKGEIMKNNEIGKEFNVANPTKDNIEYAFKICFYLIASTSLRFMKTR